MSPETASELHFDFVAGAGFEPATSESIRGLLSATECCGKQPNRLCSNGSDTADPTRLRPTLTGSIGRVTGTVRPAHGPAVLEA